MACARWGSGQRAMVHQWQRYPAGAVAGAHLACILLARGCGAARRLTPLNAGPSGWRWCCAGAQDVMASMLSSLGGAGLQQMMGGLGGLGGMPAFNPEGAAEEPEEEDDDDVPDLVEGATFEQAAA